MNGNLMLKTGKIEVPGTIRIFFLIYIVLISSYVYGQGANIMNYVEIPNSLALQLDSIYKECTNHDNVGAGINVHNLIDYKNTYFDNGLYVFGGMGPHFQQMIFISYNQVVYVLDAHKAMNVHTQLLDAKEKLRMEECDYLFYARHVSNFIRDSYKNGDYYFEDNTECYHEGIIFTVRLEHKLKVPGDRYMAPSPSRKGDATYLFPGAMTKKIQIY